jgi:Tfp pilus assembly protein PilV
VVILKKIKSATLIETLIATVLIVVVFLMASMIINTIFFNTFHQKKELVMNRLDELEYEYINKSIELPFSEEIENWNIEIIKLSQSDVVEFKAQNKITNKEIIRKLNPISNE